MIEAFREIFGLYPELLEAFDRLPDYEQAALVERAKDVCGPTNEQRMILNAAALAGITVEEVAK